MVNCLPDEAVNSCNAPLLRGLDPSGLHYIGNGILVPKVDPYGVSEQPFKLDQGSLISVLGVANIASPHNHIIIFFPSLASPSLARFVAGVSEADSRVGNGVSLEVTDWGIHVSWNAWEPGVGEIDNRVCLASETGLPPDVVSGSEHLLSYQMVHEKIGL